MTDALLRVEALSTYFYTSRGTVRAVDRVTLAADKKETVGLIGESGCGKTMTALSIMKLVPIPGKIVEGRILFDNVDLLTLPDEEMRRVRGKRIAMIFQDPLTYLNPVMKVGDQIAEAIMQHQGEDRSHARKKAIEALEMVGIASPSTTVKYYPHQLSGGMRQRILIASALSCNPSLLIADEPTTALDVTVQMQILSLIKGLREKLSLSLMLITHDLGITAEICDRVYVMYAGRIVESADVLTLYENCVHPYTKGLLKSVLRIDESKEPYAIEGTVPDLLNPPPGCRFHPRCPQAKSICHEQEPPLVEIGPGHMVSCFV